MSKAFTREQEEDGNAEDLSEDIPAPPLPTGSKNYITPEGFQRLQAELRFLLREERPKIVDIVSWAAGNGDRSENGDYLYGKKRLREIDRRVRFLTKRLEISEIVDPSRQTRLDQVFFGATVTYINGRDEQNTVTIVGVDEIDADSSRISWVCPVARALHKAREGDIVEIRTPSGKENLEIVKIFYHRQA